LKGPPLPLGGREGEGNGQTKGKGKKGKNRSQKRERITTHKKTGKGGGDQPLT